jgi:hypothetical protein
MPSRNTQYPRAGKVDLGATKVHEALCRLAD